MLKISWPVLLGVFVLAACKKEDKLFKENSSVQAETVSAVATAGADSFYFKAVIDGTPVNWAVSDQKQVSNALFLSRSSFGAGQLNGNSSATEGRYLVANTVIYKNNIHNYPQIAAGFNIATTSGERNELTAYFLPGAKAFGVPRANVSDAVKDGVFIKYIDATGKEWVSYSGTASQLNGSFESLVFTDEKRSVDGNGSKKWKASFSCKLYDGNGKSILLQKGEIYGPVL